MLTGDFNFEPDSAEYALLTAPRAGTNAMHDVWTLGHPKTPHAPTFRLHDRRYGPVTITCDFMFVSDTLVLRVKLVEVNSDTRVSDHQPVLLELR